MQNIILAIAIVLLTSVSAIGQCDKKVKWQASKAELLDESGTVVDTKQGTISITTDSNSILVEIAEEPGDKLEGAVTDLVCEWTEAFKVGKTSFKSIMSKRDGKSTGATFNVEGKDGQLIIHLQLEQMNGKTIRIVVDKHEVI